MYRTEPVSTRNRDLICWTDFVYAFIGSFVLVLLVVAGAAIGAGGSTASGGVTSYTLVPQAQTSNSYTVTNITTAIAKVTVAPRFHTVRPGDTLTKIAIRFYQRADAWTVIYWANHLKNPDVIEVGQRLVVPPLPSKIPAPPRMPVTPWHPTTSTISTSLHVSYATGGGTLSPAAIGSLWLQAGGPSWAESSAVRIAECESGGNPRAYNPSGASGVWQILGSVVAGNLFDPYTNALNAVAKFKAAGDTFVPWVCQA